MQTKGPDEMGARREGANAMVFLDNGEQVDQSDQGDHGWINDGGTSRAWRELGWGAVERKIRTLIVLAPGGDQSLKKHE